MAKCSHGLESRSERHLAIAFHVHDWDRDLNYCVFILNVQHVIQNHDSGCSFTAC